MLIDQLMVKPAPFLYRGESGAKKKKTRIRPLLFNLAELQNVCSKLFKNQSG